MSWFRNYLQKNEDLDDVYIPLSLKDASKLVGAPLGSISLEDLMNVHKQPAEYTGGYVYDEPMYQVLCHDVNASIM